MFNRGVEPIGSNKICKRDLEHEAKHLKRRLDTNEKFCNALAEFINSDCFYQIDSHSEAKTMYAIYGGLSIIVPKQRKEYDALLAEIEKESQ
jgi:hypothetical protein